MAVEPRVAIDLGEEWSVSTDRPWPRRLPRTIAALVTGAVLAALGGAQPPPLPALVVVATVPVPDATAVVATAGTLFAAAGTAGVTAYALPGSQPRWRMPLPAAVESLRFLAGAGVLL